MFKREWLAACEREDGYASIPPFTGAGEDWELIWRLRKRGATMVYVPNPVTHLRRATAGCNTFGIRSTAGWGSQFYFG